MVAPRVFVSHSHCDSEWYRAFVAARAANRYFMEQSDYNNNVGFRLALAPAGA
jgi:hypothetical protein